SGQMMRLFSSRRESITTDLRARAARFEQRYGRAPSQRELAQLAQASKFKKRAARTALDFAHLYKGWADKLARPAASRWHQSRHRAGATTQDTPPRTRDPDSIELARAARRPTRWPSRKQHLDPRRPSQVPGPRAAHDGHVPGRPRPCSKTWPNV